MIFRIISITTNTQTMATKKSRRLKFIEEDVQKILTELKRRDIDLEVENEDGVSLITYISNIEIACDLTDNEPDNWKLKNEL